MSVPARVGATADATIYKNKDDGIKKYMFATTPESQAGIPFKFSLDMIADLAFEHQKTRDDPATLELLELGANEGGNPVEYTSFKLPPGLKNRDFCVMRSDRSSEGLYEAVQRSTEHPVRKLNRPFARQSHSILKRSFYQDRLGTSIGEKVEGEDSVVAFSAYMMQGKPIEFSTEDKVNNPSGKKRNFIRAYQCVYMRMVSQDGGAWGQVCF